MNKSWYTSKAVWGGLLVATGGLATAVGQFLSGNLDFNSLLTTIFPLVGNGLGIIGVRFAIK